MRLTALLLATAMTLPIAAAQQPAEPHTNADRTVTFHYLNPSATSVTAEIDLPAKVVLTRDKNGFWTGTSTALAPEWYSYHFKVDGRTVLDPDNTNIKSSYTDVSNGFLVPGKTPRPWETADVPHGTIHHHFYTTHIVTGLPHQQSDFYVYTPPSYDPQSTTKYPVLYLLHGWSDTAAGWTEIGDANQILDNLLAAGKIQPMIVVMPLGYGALSFVRSGGDVWHDANAVTQNTELFKQALLTEVLPAVERQYNVIADRDHRAIAGLSMGGLESLTVGLTDTKQFSWIGGFSSAVHLVQPTDFSAPDPNNAVNLLWIACGTGDSLYAPNQKLIANLKTLGYPVTAISTPGVHSWLVWRDNLVHFLPLLFSQKTDLGVRKAEPVTPSAPQ